MKIFNSQKGFSLVELLVAATIIGLLAATGMVSYTSANRNARDAKRKTDLEQVRAAIELYRTEEGCYPGSSSACGGTGMDFEELLDEVNQEGYLNNIQNIQDPKPSPHPQYTYSITSLGSCNTYRLTATLEKGSPATYELCNP